MSTGRLDREPGDAEGLRLRFALRFSRTRCSLPLTDGRRDDIRLREEILPVDRRAVRFDFFNCTSMIRRRRRG